MFYSPKIIRAFYPGFYWSLPETSKTIYLTFDDGPIPEVTPFVLKTLKEFNAKATFFCIGENVIKHPKIFNSVVEDGHGIGNHTFNHLNGWKTPKDNYLENISQCQETMAKTNKIKLFRPPYGRITKAQASLVSDLSYKVIMWSVLSKDYDKGILPKKCLEKSIKHSKNGSIIVFHDSQKAFKNLEFVLPKYLKHFTELGYSFKNLASSF